MRIVLGRVPSENRYHRPNIEVAPSDGEKGVSAVSEASVFRGRGARLRSSRGVPCCGECRSTCNGLRATLSPLQQNFESLGTRSRTTPTCENNFSPVVSHE